MIGIVALSDMAESPASFSVTTMPYESSETYPHLESRSGEKEYAARAESHRVDAILWYAKKF